MVAVRIISECTIRPTTPASDSTHTIRLPLTPWDLRLLLVNYNQKGLLYLPNPTPQNGVVVVDKATAAHIHHLKNTLSQALDFFPPLAGRLAATKHPDGATTFSLNCTAAGAVFVHAAADAVTAAEVLASASTPSESIVYSFFPLNGVLDYEGTSKPLLAVQATELAGGGLFLAWSINHCVVDGTTFWHFINSWSEIARNPSAETISKLPVFDWDDLRRPVPIPDFPYDDENPAPRDGFNVQLQERVYNFSREKIAMLKERANGQASGGSDGKISSLQAILAHLWRAVTRGRRASPDLEMHFRLMVGARARLRPPVPDEFFGNMITAAGTAARAGDLEEAGLGFAAAEINKLVAAQSEKEMKRYLDEWVREPRILRLGTFGSNALSVGSSPRFNVYGNDFGWGRPAAVRSGMADKFDGQMTVFPGAAEGSMDVEVCLLPGTLVAMEDDGEFTEAVTV